MVSKIINVNLKRLGGWNHEKNETERLYLRELIMDDIQELSKVLSDPESIQYYNEPFNQEKVEKWTE